MDVPLYSQCQLVRDLQTYNADILIGTCTGYELSDTITLQLM